MRAGVGHLTVVAFPPFRNSGLVISGVDVFIDVLFSDYNLRTLVVETNEGEFGSLPLCVAFVLPA